jgi:cell division protein FtsN
MAHFDRGVYEPGEDMRVFDGSEDEDDVEGSRLPLLIVLALLVLAMFAGVVWLAYTQGVARGRTETPVLTAENGPARIAPQNPGGVEQPYKGFKIYEQPAPPDDTVDTATTPAVSAPAPVAKPAPVVSPPAAKSAPVAVMPTPPKAVVAAAPPPPVAKVAAPAPKIAAVTPAPAAVKPAPVAVKPAPAPAKPQAPVIARNDLPPAAAAPVGPATAAPRSLALTPAKPVSTPAAPVATPAATPAPAAASGAYVLQIGAYKSQADADAAWTAYKAKHGALLSGASDNVQQADLGDKGTWYRLRIVGFPSKDVASAMCDRLKADGGTCFPGK